MLSQRQFRIARDIIQRGISKGWSDRKRRLFFNVYYIGRLMNLILYPAMKLTQFFKRRRPSFRVSLHSYFLPLLFLCRLTELRGGTLFVLKFILWKTFVNWNMKRISHTFILISEIDSSRLDDKLSVNLSRQEYQTSINLKIWQFKYPRNLSIYLLQSIKIYKNSNKRSFLQGEPCIIKKAKKEFKYQCH